VAGVNARVEQEYHVVMFAMSLISPSLSYSQSQFMHSKF